jgi:Tfp pilus assembly protein PilN
MRAVNLLPRDETKRQQPGAVVLTAVLGSVLVVALLAGLFLMTSSQAGETQKSERVTLLGKALGSRIAWDRVLREISLVLPEDIWLESLTASAPDPNFTPVPGQTEAPPGGFTITGYSYSHDGVARLLARLSVLPELDRPTLGTSAIDTTKGRGVVKFTISASLKQGQVA